MKFTLSWLKRHLDTSASLEEICAKLTAIGLEVEAVEDKAKLYAPFKVAYVESAEKHPDADKLKLCKVKTEKGIIQVVCGAPNAHTGMKGIFAPEGSVIPNTGDVLKKGMIRGVESQGMLVSEREMNLSDEHKGIIEVDDKFAIGTPLAEVLGLNDATIEINLTPNRIDAAGVRGIARDLAAAGLGNLKPLDDKPVKAAGKSPIAVSIEDKDGCPLFLGRYISDVKNGPSPQWMQDLLKSVGLRPISALVDITNFMSLDACRPLHVFDADKIKGNIKVRQTKKGETLEGLNDKTYTLQDGAVGICDDSGVTALGGIVGGVPTGCTEETVNVFVEAAYFNPVRISRTGRDMQIDSDARYRFERGVDPEFTVAGMEIATKLILEICGGRASEVVTAGAMPKWQRSIDYDPSWFASYIGADVAPDVQKKILETLGFEISGGKTWQIQPPSWRSDVEAKQDIAEEIIRIHGFEHIPSLSVRSEAPVADAAETQTLSRVRRARNALAARGLDECVTWSFMGREQALAFNDNKSLEALTLKNPISSDLDVMRPSILPNLIAAAGYNHDRGQSDVALCEVGPAFKSVKPEGQAIVAAGIRAGNDSARHWAGPVRGTDAYDAKADAFAALEACGAPSTSAQITRDAPSYYHPGRSGVLRLGPNVLAYFGEIHPAILDEMGIKTSVSGFEVFLQNIPESKKKGTEKSLLKIEPLQAVSRDFAFMVDAKVNAEDIVKAAKSADKNLITDAYIFDVYTGKGVEPGKKSVAFAVTIQPREKSLTDAELEEISRKIVGAVIAKTGGTLRS
ncbi:MAG: phenylalanine--tRNA ligase subunit beta [Alphaproteobacteria bacterium PRO2]|nr:phenylalanine--tRNA ligase subunit beta [Alphaproteobacteria bacterium PRO2]